MLGDVQERLETGLEIPLPSREASSRLTMRIGRRAFSYVATTAAFLSVAGISHPLHQNH